LGFAVIRTYGRVFCVVFCKSLLVICPCKSVYLNYMIVLLFNSVTRRVSLVQQELHALPEHLNSPPVLIGFEYFLCIVLSFNHCIPRPSSYSFWFPHWCLQYFLSILGSTPVILLLFNAGPLNITIIDDDDRVVAIMECFFPAQATGEAIRMVLTNSGNNSNPGGRLPFTWLMYDYQVCIFLFFFCQPMVKLKL
jgi:hypothetical protein